MFKTLWTTDRIFRNLMISTIALVLFTSIHHLYGGAIYDTSWRIIMPLFFFLPMLALTLFLQTVSAGKKSILLLLTYTVLTVAGWVIMIGAVEGGYNHVVKNILFFSGASEDLMHTFFPPEFGGTKLFEIPNDFIFEISGMLTTAFGVIITAYLIPFFIQQWKRITTAAKS